MYVCSFCEEKTNKVVGFVVINENTQTQKADETLKLCFSCFEENTENEIRTDHGAPLPNITCMFCKKVVCWMLGGNTKECGVEVCHGFVHYRICKDCWKKERDY